MATKAILDPDYNPTREEFLTDIGVSFLFATISSAITTKSRSEAAKARLEGDLDRTKELYAQIAWKKAHGMGTDEELLRELSQATQGLRETLSNTQYVGHGQEVQSALSQLDWIDDQIWLATQELGGNMVHIEPTGTTGTLALPFGAATDEERQAAMSEILTRVFDAQGAEKELLEVRQEEKGGVHQHGWNEEGIGKEKEEGLRQNVEPFTREEDYGKIIAGALNPESVRASKHAERYYEEVRHMTTDVGKIAKATGYSETEIQAIKDFLFIEEHDLDGSIQRFYPDYMIAESWQRLVNGTPEPHDLTLIRHEIMERSLMAQGYTQAEAHEITSKVFNYDKEASAFYGKAEKHKEK